MKTNNFKARSTPNTLKIFKSNRLTGANAIALLLTAFIFSLMVGCDPSGSVGGGFADPNTDIRFDTTALSQVQIDTLVAYSGNLDFFSAGKFQDPLFGDVTAKGFFKPPLGSNRDTLAFDDSTKVFLNLAIYDDGTYGDSLADQTFGLYEAQQLWRGNQWQLNTTIPIAPTPITTFTVQSQDTLLHILMPDSWAAKYASYFELKENNRDSIYVREFFGLAMVPQNLGSVVAVNPYGTSLLITKLKVVLPDSEVVEVPRLDSLEIPIRTGDWAYNLQRTNITPSPAAASKLVSTYERILHFDHNFDLGAIKRRDIARVELVFYVDKLLLEQSLDQVGAAATRPQAKYLNLFYIEADELPQALSSYTNKNQFEYARAEYSEQDNAYHFDITTQIKNGFFNATGEERDFYITVGSNNGVIRSTVLFNSLTSGKEPIIIITYTEIDK